MKNIITLSVCFITLMGFSQADVAPSVDENYVYKIVYKQAYLESQLPTVPYYNKVETISYFDGLGRPLQSVGVRQGGKNTSDHDTDIVTHFVYDGFGRQTKEYLPFATSTNDGKINDDPLSEISSFYLNHFPEDLDANFPNPYALKRFDNSPLNRVIEQGAPGHDWQLTQLNFNNQSIKFDYSSNAIEEVVKFKVTFLSNSTEQPQLVYDNHYQENTLYKTVTKDENWSVTQPNIKDHTTEEFKDKNGRVILKRTYNNGQLHNTYYTYDDFGNLTFVISPEGSESIVDGSDTIDTATLDKFCYQYIYDQRNRLIEKKIPGKGWEYIIYDVLDRPILTQDANLKTQNQWLFTKYDAHNRVVYTGMHRLPKPLSRGKLQSIIINGINNSTYSINEVRSKGATYIASDVTTELYYTNTAYPSSMESINVYTIDYYDNHASQIVPSALAYQDSYGQTLSSNNTGLPTVNRVRTLNTNDWSSGAVYYGDKGRTIFAASENEYLNHNDWSKLHLDFTGNAQETETSHSKVGQSNLLINDLFEYDHVFRVKQHTQQINGQDTEVITNNNYDELGQLYSKGVGDIEASPLQTVDYTYNIRGWLKSINDVQNLQGDLFGFKINYNTTELSSDSGYYEPTALFNGNISETIWQTANDAEASVNQRGYFYLYDNLNRITKGEFRKDGGTSQNGQFDLSLVNYDKNGNILALNRTGNTDSGSFDDMYDKLVYTYNGNQLTDVEENGNHSEGFIDAGNEQIGDYIYDANGNLIVDHNKSISNISYNHLNLPTVVSTSNGSIVYVYDATGMKLEKQVNEGRQPTIFTRYAGNYIYKEEAATGEQLQFFSQPEGYVEPAGKSTFNYVYQYKDHLGNIRLSYQKDEANSLNIFEDYQSNTGDWVVYSPASVALVNDKLAYSSAPRWKSINKFETVTPGVPIHIEFDFEKGSMMNPVFAVKEKINGVWESDSDRDYFVLNDGHFETDLTLQGEEVRFYFIKAHASDNGTLTTCYIDNFMISQNILEIKEENNYYPFGLKHKGYNNLIVGTDHQYGFGNKEEQNELGLAWQDFGARNYEASIGRWMNIDPMAEYGKMLTPYQYSFNNPIMFIDEDGKWSVSTHYRITYELLSTLGFSLKSIKSVSHYTSVYADHPSKLVLIANNFVGDGLTYAESYHRNVDYNNTKNSQNTEYDPIRSTDYNYNIWHSMRSNREAELGTISEKDAMKRGQKFGWDMIFGSAREGKMGSFKTNDTGLQMLGQGLHALQDSYAHEGTNMDNHDIKNDIYGDTSKAKDITSSAIFVHSVMSGDTDTMNTLLNKGVTSLDLSGISGDNLINLNDSLKAQGKTLKYNWNTKKYDVN